MKIYEHASTIDNLIEKTLSNIKTISTNETVFGEEKVLSDGTTIIPISKATIGFVVGGGEYSDLSSRRVATHYPMAGGSGGGIVLQPIGFLISTKDQVSYVSTRDETNYEKILEMIGSVSEKISNAIKKKEKENYENK